MYGMVKNSILNQFNKNNMPFDFLLMRWQSFILIKYMEHFQFSFFVEVLNCLKTYHQNVLSYGQSVYQNIN